LVFVFVFFFGGVGIAPPEHWEDPGTQNFKALAYICSYMAFKIGYFSPYLAAINMFWGPAPAQPFMLARVANDHYPKRARWQRLGIAGAEAL
jgi:hypothetical protein